MIQQRRADLRFKEQLQQTRLQSASSKKKLGDELKAIEHEMRRDKLLWLQELETVRDRFADMADDMKDNESKRELDQEIQAMQQEQEYEQQYQAKADEVDRQNVERFDRDLLFLQNKKRAETKVEGQALVKEWTAEEKTLEGEVVEARRTRKQMRRRLQQKLLDRRNQHMANLGHLVDSDIVHHSDYLNVDEQPLEIAGIVNDVKGF